MPERFALGKYLFVHDAYDAGGVKDGNGVVIHAHDHNDRPVVEFMRICLGLDDRVAVLDMKEMVMLDSDGVRYAVDKSRLLGPLYAEYW
jgi:hypothetical protein